MAEEGKKVPRYTNTWRGTITKNASYFILLCRKNIYGYLVAPQAHLLI